MTSFAIIAENAPKVNVKPSNNGPFPPLSEKNTSSYIAVSRCETFDPDPHATNQWQALRMSFEWHGDDVASFNDEIHTLIKRNVKCATFRPISQPTTRVIMCADLLENIIARTTYNLATHNGKISFVNGKVIRFRAKTIDEEKRVIEEKRGKKKWKLKAQLTPMAPSRPSSHLTFLKSPQTTILAMQKQPPMQREK